MIIKKMKMKTIKFYHVEQAKKFASFLGAYINQEVTDAQFQQMCNCIDSLKQLTTELYEKSKEN